MINWGNKGKIVCFKLLSRKQPAAPEQKDEKRDVRLGYPSVLDRGVTDVTVCANSWNSVINRR